MTRLPRVRPCRRAHGHPAPPRLARWICSAMLALVPAAVSAQTERTGADSDADGVRTHYETMGEGPALVFLHGFGARFSTTPLPPSIVTATAGHRLIGMDVRGFGDSGRPAEPEAYGTEVARDVIRLLDHLGIEKADVFGFSMGGIIALETAAMYPDRVRTLVLGGQGWASRWTD